MAQRKVSLKVFAGSSFNSLRCDLSHKRFHPIRRSARRIVLRFGRTPWRSKIEWPKLWLRDDRRSLSLVLVGDAVKHGRNDDFHNVSFSQVFMFNFERRLGIPSQGFPFPFSLSIPVFTLLNEAVSRTPRKTLLEI